MEKYASCSDDYHTEPLSLSAGRRAVLFIVLNHALRDLPEDRALRCAFDKQSKNIKLCEAVSPRPGDAGRQLSRPSAPREGPGGRNVTVTRGSFTTSTQAAAMP
jgi:hypothetical protein